MGIFSAICRIVELEQKAGVVLGTPCKPQEEKTMSDTPTFQSFNPTNDTRVAEIKKATDDLIELVRRHGNGTPEGARRIALAVTNYEQAAMWAVKSCFS